MTPGDVDQLLHVLRQHGVSHLEDGAVKIDLTVNPSDVEAAPQKRKVNLLDEAVKMGGG